MATRNAGTAVAARRKVITFRPPMRSVIMPVGSRHSEPFRAAAATSQDSSTSVSPNSSWMGLPRMPNISHTANISVNPTVDSHSTRFAPDVVSLISTPFSMRWAQAHHGGN